MNLKELHKLNEEISTEYNIPINFISMNRSDHYPAAYFRSSLFILALTYLVFYFIPFDIQDPIWMIGLSIPAVFIGQILPLSERYKRIFISNGEMKEECYQQALEQGHELGVLNESSSIYIYLSEFERRIEIFIPNQLKGIKVKDDLKPHFKGLIKKLKKGTDVKESFLEFYSHILIKNSLPISTVPLEVKPNKEEIEDRTFAPYNVEAKENDLTEPGKN